MLYATAPAAARDRTKLDGILPATDFLVSDTGIGASMRRPGRRTGRSRNPCCGDTTGLSVPAYTFTAMSTQSGPHDAVFRRVLGEPSNAASQLRATLPAGLVGRLDLDRLTRVSGSFVDARLRWRHSDLLFTAPLEGHEAFVYILVEHQNGADPLMPFRMLRYVVRIWDCAHDAAPAQDRHRQTPGSLLIFGSGPMSYARFWTGQAASRTSSLS